MPTREEALAELERRKAKAMGGAQMPQPAMPVELEDELAAQAQTQAMAPVEIEESIVEPVIKKPSVRNDVLKAQFTKPSTKKGKAAPVDTYNYEGIDIDVSTYPEFSGVGEASKTKAVLDKSSLALKQIASINEKMKELKKLDKANTISVANPYIGKYVNKLRDIGGNMGIDTKQMVKRKALESEMARMRVNADTALKGSGPLGRDMYARFESMNIHPNLIEEGFPVTEEKLKDLEKDLKALKVGAQIGLKTKRSIPYDDVEVLLQEKQQQPKAEAPKKGVDANRRQQLLDRYNSDPANERFLSLPDDVKLDIMAEAGDI